MGVAKEYMMELLAARPVHLEVGFLCPACGHPSAAFIDMPGDADDHTEEVACLNPEQDHDWTVNLEKTEEYYSGSVEGHPDVDVTISVLHADDDEDWDEPLPEPGSNGIFMEAMREWRHNLSVIGEPIGDSSRNRMLFTTLYSILEAYMSDTIIGAALADKSVQRKMLYLYGLKDAQVSLETIIDKPTIVQEMVKTTLQALSFHNLTGVNGICLKVFGKPLLPKDSHDRALVTKSVDKRHDCVHRSGVDKEGTKHVDIDNVYLMKLGGIFQTMVDELESAMQDAKIARFLEDLGPDKPDEKKGA